MEYMPPTGRLYKVQAINYWTVVMKPEGTLSRSWNLYGEQRALGKCLRWCWEQATKMGAGECPWQWVKDIGDWRSWTR